MKSGSATRTTIILASITGPLLLLLLNQLLTQLLGSCEHSGTVLVATAVGVVLLASKAGLLSFRPSVLRFESSTGSISLEPAAATSSCYCNTAAASAASTSPTFASVLRSVPANTPASTVALTVAAASIPAAALSGPNSAASAACVACDSSAQSDRPHRSGAAASNNASEDTNVASAPQQEACQVGEGAVGVPLPSQELSSQPTSDCTPQSSVELTQAGVWVDSSSQDAPEPLASYLNQQGPVDAALISPTLGQPPHPSSMPPDQLSQTLPSVVPDELCYGRTEIPLPSLCAVSLPPFGYDRMLVSPPHGGHSEALTSYSGSVGDSIAHDSVLSYQQCAQVPSGIASAGKAAGLKPCKATVAGVKAGRLTSATTKVRNLLRKPFQATSSGNGGQLMQSNKDGDRCTMSSSLFGRANKVLPTPVLYAMVHPKLAPSGGGGGGDGGKDTSLPWGAAGNSSSAPPANAAAPFEVTPLAIKEAGVMETQESVVSRALPSVSDLAVPCADFEAARTLWQATAMAKVDDRSDMGLPISNWLAHGPDGRGSPAPVKAADPAPHLSKSSNGDWQGGAPAPHMSKSSNSNWQGGSPAPYMSKSSYGDWQEGAPHMSWSSYCDWRGGAPYMSKSSNDDWQGGAPNVCGDFIPARNVLGGEPIPDRKMKGRWLSSDMAQLQIEMPQVEMAHSVTQLHRGDGMSPGNESLPKNASQEQLCSPECCTSAAAAAPPDSAGDLAWAEDGHEFVDSVAYLDAVSACMGALDPPMLSPKPVACATPLLDPSILQDLGLPLEMGDLGLPLDLVGMSLLESFAYSDPSSYIPSACAPTTTLAHVAHGQQLQQAGGVGGLWRFPSTPIAERRAVMLPEGADPGGRATWTSQLKDPLASTESIDNLLGMAAAAVAGAADAELSGNYFQLLKSPGTTTDATAAACFNAKGLDNAATAVAAAGFTCLSMESVCGAACPPQLSEQQEHLRAISEVNWAVGTNPGGLQGGSIGGQWAGCKRAVAAAPLQPQQLWGAAGSFGPQGGYSQGRKGHAGGRNGGGSNGRKKKKHWDVDPVAPSRHALAAAAAYAATSEANGDQAH